MADARVTLLPRDKMDRIPALTARELRGWWWAVTKLRVRPELPGERAAVLQRARAVGVDLDGALDGGRAA